MHGRATCTTFCACIEWKQKINGKIYTKLNKATRVTLITWQISYEIEQVDMISAVPVEVGEQSSLSILNEFLNTGLQSEPFEFASHKLVTGHHWVNLRTKKTNKILFRSLLKTNIVLSWMKLFYLLIIYVLILLLLRCLPESGISTLIDLGIGRR